MSLTKIANQGTKKIAFDEEEQNVINNVWVENADNLSNATNGGKDTEDKIFLISNAEIYSKEAESYGFMMEKGGYDEARCAIAGDYAKAMGVSEEDESDELFSGYGKGNSFWWLRSLGVDNYVAEFVTYDGRIIDSSGGVNDFTLGVRPALYLDLSATDYYTYAGTVCSDGTVTEP